MGSTSVPSRLILTSRLPLKALRRCLVRWKGSRCLQIKCRQPCTGSSPQVPLAPDSHSDPLDLEGPAPPFVASLCSRRVLRSIRSIDSD